jgi:nitrile hydratase accessory protein
MKSLPLPETGGWPSDDNGPVFNAPWEAQAFAMAVSLHARGVFTWPEWADALAQRIAQAQAAGDADLGDTYYVHWLGALEDLVASKAVTTPEELRKYRHGWEHAAQRTPHGQPVELHERDLHQ